MRVGGRKEQEYVERFLSLLGDRFGNMQEQHSRLIDSAQLIHNDLSDIAVNYSWDWCGSLNSALTILLSFILFKASREQWLPWYCSLPQVQAECRCSTNISCCLLSIFFPIGHFSFFASSFQGTVTMKWGIFRREAWALFHQWLHIGIKYIVESVGFWTLATKYLHGKAEKLIYNKYTWLLHGKF